MTYGGEPLATEPAQTAGSSSVKVTTIGSSGGGAAVRTCSISLKGTSIPVTRTNAAPVKLADTGGATCKGAVSLSIPIEAKGKKAEAKSKSAKSRQIGSAPLQLTPGRAATVLVPLNGAGKAALARAAGGLKASLTVDAGNARIADTLRLRAAGPKHHAKHRRSR